MTAIEISCSQCGSGEYRVIDSRTGEIACLYCRNQWIVPALAHKSETEKYLVEQAKQPRVILDNSSETDRQMMNAVSGLTSLLSFNFLHSIGLALRRFLKVVLFAIAVVIVALAAFIIIRFYL